MGMKMPVLIYTKKSNCQEIRKKIREDNPETKRFLFFGCTSDPKAVERFGFMATCLWVGKYPDEIVATINDIQGFP